MPRLGRVYYRPEPSLAIGCGAADRCGAEISGVRAISALAGATGRGSGRRTPGGSPGLAVSVYGLDDCRRFEPGAVLVISLLVARGRG